jgi:hypothetical protein
MLHDRQFRSTGVMLPSSLKKLKATAAGPEGNPTIRKSHEQSDCGVQVSMGFTDRFIFAA